MGMQILNQQLPTKCCWSVVGRKMSQHGILQCLWLCGGLSPAFCCPMVRTRILFNAERKGPEPVSLLGFSMYLILASAEGKS